MLMMTRLLKNLLGRVDGISTWISLAIFLSFLVQQLLFVGFLMLVCNINLVYFFFFQQTLVVGDAFFLFLSRSGVIPDCLVMVSLSSGNEIRSLVGSLGKKVTTFVSK
jgi:hypothetical protein